MKLGEQQEPFWKIVKYMKMKQCIPEQPMDQRRHQKRNKKILKQIKMET
jgi:hypothetical protein